MFIIEEKTIMKQKLLEQISEIHANKCYHSKDFTEAKKSFEELSEFKKEIFNASSSDLQSIVDKIESWSKAYI